MVTPALNENYVDSFAGELNELSIVLSSNRLFRNQRILVKHLKSFTFVSFLN